MLGRNPRRPFLRQLQTIGYRQVRMGVGQRQRHCHLTVVLLAELAAILARYTHSASLAWEARVIS
jgi:hypothetical protein